MALRFSSPEEAALAISAGASGLGLVSAMPSGPGVVATFLLASRQGAERDKLRAAINAVAECSPDIQ